MTCGEAAEHRNTKNDEGAATWSTESHSVQPCGELWWKEIWKDVPRAAAAPRSQESRAYVQEQNGRDRRGHQIKMELASTSPPARYSVQPLVAQ